jgi:hypothetical protein
VLAVIGAGNAGVPSSVAKSNLSQFARHHGLNIIFDDHFLAGCVDEPKTTEFLIPPQILDTKTQVEEYRDRASTTDATSLSLSFYTFEQKRGKNYECCSKNQRARAGDG